MKASERKELLSTLQRRFEANTSLHPGLAWDSIATKLAKQPKKLVSLLEMESTGGEPDVIGYDPATDEYLFCDCSPESPTGRRSVCYDREGLESRKEQKPANSAVEMAASMGIELLDEKLYRKLQDLGEFDTKTSSWLVTPFAIRILGGALFGDRRYNAVFVYHNGAQSYYAARGFRGLLRV
ncbi:MAG: DUF4256 domain-containing protein [Zavarzinella sp.]